MKRPKTGGRQKGTPNKATKRLEELVRETLGRPAIEVLCDRFREAETDTENPQRADRLICEIVSYCHAKPKAAEAPPETDTPPPAEVLPIDIEARMRALKAAK